MNKFYSLMRLPAVLALLMQCLSLLTILAILFLFNSFLNLTLPVLGILFLQGAIAALLSWWRGLAPWWLLLQFIFLPGLYATMILQLPPELYLLAFLLLLLLYWSTFRTQVPFYPSGPAAWGAVAELLPQTQSVRFVDIGSGFGGMVAHLARARPDCDIAGIELAPLPWITSRLIAILTGSKGRFLHGDYNQLDFAEFDIVFAYLSPAAMPALWDKARAQMRPGSLLMSYEFVIPGTESQITNISVINGRNLYQWGM